MMRREGCKFIAEAPGKVVGIIEHKGRIFVATERQVFELIDGVFCPLFFTWPDDVGGQAHDRA